MSEDTEMIERHAEAKADGFIKALLSNWRSIAAALGIGGAVVGGHVDSRNQAHDTLWAEGGSHFQDLLQTNNVQEKELSELRDRVWKLENPLASKLSKTNFTEKDLSNILNEVDSEMNRKYP